MNTIEIPISKLKNTKTIIASLLVLALGVALQLYPEYFASSFIKSQRLIVYIGIATFAFAVYALVAALKKFFGTSPLLIIDENGITNNITNPDIGLIKWEDIKEIGTTKIEHTKFISIFTKNPEEYLDRVGLAKRTMLQGNVLVCNTPFIISTANLKYSFKDLEQLLQDRLKEYKDKKRAANTDEAKKLDA